MENEQEGAKEEVSPASTPEPQSATAAETSTPDVGGAAQPTQNAEKTYTGKEMASIVSQRINESQAKYKEFGDPESIRARLTRAEQAEKLVQQWQAEQAQRTPAAPVKQLTDEQKQFVTWLKSEAVPEIGKLTELQEKYNRLESYMNDRQQSDFRTLVQNGKSEISNLSKTIGITDATQVRWIEDQIANSIASNKEDAIAFNRGDMSVLKKHFETFNKEFLDPLIRKNQGQLADTKQKTANLPPVVKGGVPAAVTKTKKLSQQESANAAFVRLQELEKVTGGA